MGLNECSLCLLVYSLPNGGRCRQLRAQREWWRAENIVSSQAQQFRYCLFGLDFAIAHPKFGGSVTSTLIDFVFSRK